MINSWVMPLVSGRRPEGGKPQSDKAAADREARDLWREEVTFLKAKDYKTHAVHQQTADRIRERWPQYYGQLSTKTIRYRMQRRTRTPERTPCHFGRHFDLMVRYGDLMVRLGLAYAWRTKIGKKCRQSIIADFSPAVSRHGALETVEDRSGSRIKAHRRATARGRRVARHRRKQAR
jgi:hypothetical protein